MFRKWVAFLSVVIPLCSGAQNIDLLILNKNYLEALARIEQQLAESTNPLAVNAELYFKQATVYRQLSEPLKAARSLEQAMSIDTASCKYLTEYADLMAELGNVYEAIKHYSHAVFHSPDDLNLKCKLGKAYMNVENYQGAFEVFRMIQTTDSTNLVYNKQFGLAALRTGKTDLAIRMFESVLQYNPNDFSVYMNLILLYMKNKNAVHIIRTADRALYFFPENSAILLREANSLYALKEYEEARPAFELYLAQNDSVFDVLENYGITLYFIHDEPKARKIMEKCFTLDPANQFVNFYLGLICKKLADYPRSAEFLNMAIATSQPAYLTEMYHHLGQVFGLQREFKKSIEALEEAYKCNPLRYEILVEIATTYEEFDSNKKLALTYYRKYLKEAGDKAMNAEYALQRIKEIEKDLLVVNK